MLRRGHMSYLHLMVTVGMELSKVTSYALFDINGHQVPQQLVAEVGEIFETILKKTEKVRNENAEDMSVLQSISIVLNRHPELRQEGLAYEILQWYICRMEAWFAADVDTISLKNWDQEHVLTGGYGLMVHGYHPVIKALAKDLDIRLNNSSFSRLLSMGRSRCGCMIVWDLELTMMLPDIGAPQWHIVLMEQGSWFGFGH